MRVNVRFFSYFKDLAGCGECVEEVRAQARLAELVEQVLARFPRLAPLRKSMLLAVGVEYQGPEYVLQAGDVVSLFPPVQGG